MTDGTCVESLDGWSSFPVPIQAGRRGTIHTYGGEPWVQWQGGWGLAMANTRLRGPVRVVSVVELLAEVAQ